MTREDLRINDWLELIKEDKNLNGAYISIAQYVYLIEEENQELKLELSGYRQAILNNKEMLGLKEQNQALKKQLENYKKLGFKHLVDKNNNLETQQKEFIKYLEDEIEKQKEDIFENSLTAKDIDLYIKRIKLLKIEEILQKYREIIGENDV